MKRSKRFIMPLAMLGCAVAWADAEVIDELSLDADTTVSVESGATKRIEYLSGTASAMLTKDGAGTLEIAIVGNTNATIRVKAGTLKSVRPGKLALASDEAAFHVDGSDADARDVTVVNGTNFVTKIKDADGRSTYATSFNSRPNPYLAPNALNGLTVFDFGTMQGSGLTGYGAAMTWSERHLPNEVFYVWVDQEGLKNLVTSNDIGPTPVNMWYAGYRGKGGAGVGFKLFNANRFMTANLYLDDAKAAADTAPVEGWHLLRTYTSTFIDATAGNISNYAARGFGYRPNGYQYGGFRLAEMVVCSNYLSVAKRAYVNFYLNQKWFGGYPFKQLFVSPDATVDTSETVLKVTTLNTGTNAVLTGGNLLFSDSYSSLEFAAVSGTVEAKDRGTSLTENLAFTGDATISVSSGTAAVDRVTSTSGILAKSGEGALELAFPGAGVTSLVVSAGTLVVDPMRTTRAYLHVDANAEGSMMFSDLNGTNLVTIWNDVNGNGRYMKQSGENHAYGSKGKKNYPYFDTNFTNGLSVVDFGTFSSYAYQDGWGAEMDLYPRVNSPESDANPLIYNVFAVWGDRDDSVSLPLVNGVTFRGPCLFGAGGAWYRGYGGGGTRFTITSTSSSTMGESNYINGEFVDYVHG